MSDDIDILERLRAVLHNDRSVELMNREAAEEIERLQAEFAACRIAYEQAIKDRDAARLAYCRDAFYLVGDEDEQRQLTPREIAGRQRWPWPIPGSEVAR